MYSENMALPATFIAARRAAVAPAVQQLINISYPSGPQQQTHSSDVLRANGTDRRTSYCFIDPASHTVPAAPVIEILRHRHVTITQKVNK